MGLRPLEIFYFFQRGDRLYTSESDVYRRQIMTYKDGPRAERVNPTAGERFVLVGPYIQCNVHGWFRLP